MACAQWLRGVIPRDGELGGQRPRGAGDSHGREQALREEAESHRGDRSRLLGLHYFFIDVPKLNPRSTPRQPWGRVGRIATTTGRYGTKKFPGSDLRGALPPNPLP